jgi:hypothetical protein
LQSAAAGRKKVSFGSSGGRSGTNQAIAPPEQPHAIGPPAPPLGDPRQTSSLGTGSPLRRKLRENPAGSQQECFHVGLEPDAALQRGEVNRSRSVGTRDGEVYTAARIVMEQREPFIAADECPGSNIHSAAYRSGCVSLQREECGNLPVVYDAKWRVSFHDARRCRLWRPARTASPRVDR